MFIILHEKIGPVCVYIDAVDVEKGKIIDKTKNKIDFLSLTVATKYTTTREV